MKRRVLIADDEADLVTLLQKRLSKSNYEVLVARDGQEALSVIRKKKPDIVLLDLILPVMDGHEVCKAIKSDMSLRNIPVIMLTAASIEHDRVAGLTARADNFIAKPFDLEELLRSIDKLLKK